MEDTVLVIDGLAVLVARYPADEHSFSEGGTVVKAPVNTVDAGMTYDGSAFHPPT